jgi:hypothetical protein
MPQQPLTQPARSERPRLRGRSPPHPTPKSGDQNGVTREYSSSPATGREISAHHRPPTSTNHLGSDRDAPERAAPRTMEAAPFPKHTRIRGLARSDTSILIEAPQRAVRSRRTESHPPTHPLAPRGRSTTHPATCEQLERQQCTSLRTSERGDTLSDSFSTPRAPRCLREWNLCAR